MMVTLQVFSVFLALLLTVPCTTSVTVTTSKPKVEVHENTNAVLSCEFRTEKEANPRIEWKKKGKDVSYVYFDGEFTGSFKGRASIDGAIVTLHGVTQKDSGVYLCEVTARHDKVHFGEATVTLSVLVAAHVPSCKVPEMMLKGSAVELQCKDKLSVPPAIYSWYKDNKPLSTGQHSDINYSLDPKSGTLKFKSVSKSDEGQYRCEASNGIGAPKSCAGQHMKVIEFELNLTLIIALGVGAGLFLLSCCLAICLCCRRGCCHCCRSKEKKKVQQKRNTASYHPPSDLRHYKHTKSFMI